VRAPRFPRRHIFRMAESMNFPATPLLRRAGADDAPALARLRYAFRSALGVSVEDAEVFTRRCAGWMRPRLAAGDVWRCWLAEWSGEVGGAVWVQFVEKLPNPVAEPEWHAYLTNLYVQPARRGGGAGSALLRLALEACDARGIDAVFLWPTPRSRALYERHGFAARDDLLQRRGAEAADRGLPPFEE
jgi:ribosomal protein S18 acetylase RimI-like enzyme